VEPNAAIPGSSWLLMLPECIDEAAAVWDFPKWFKMPRPYSQPGIRGKVGLELRVMNSDEETLGVLYGFS